MKVINILFDPWMKEYNCVITILMLDLKEYNIVITVSDFGPKGV